MPSEPDGDRPRYVKCIDGRWYWDPPGRLRRSHGLRTVALGASQAEAWAYARTLNRDHLQLGPGAPAPGTVRWLLEAFLASERFERLRPSTQGDYRWLARRVLAPAPLGGKTLGDIMAAGVRPRHADALYARLCEMHGHAAAHYACRLARRVWHWGIRREIVAANPWTGMELPSVPRRRQRWTPEQVAAVRAKAIEQGRPSIALAVLIAYSFSHRQADVLALTWSALDAGEVATQKTGEVLPVSAAAYPELDAALRAERARQAEAHATRRQCDGVIPLPSAHVLICETTGEPWRADFFRHEFRRIADLAGLPADLQFRDLRATALTELSDGGADVIAMSTHSGHRTVQMARRYARPTGEQFRRAAEQRQRGKK